MNTKHTISLLGILSLIFAFPAVAQIKANLNTDVGVSIGTSTATTTLSATSSTSMTKSTSTMSTDEADVTTFVVTRGDLSGTASIGSTDQAMVETSSDLNIYAKSVMTKDENVTKLDIGKDKIVVSYKVPSKFLWFIPSKIVARATIKSDGTTNINYPWYTFLSSKNDAEIKANLQAQVSAITNNGAELSSRTKAEIINAAVNTFKSKTEVKTETTVN